MRADSVVGEQGVKFLRVPVGVSFTEIGQHLPHLGAAEQMLIRSPEEGHQ